MARTTNNSNATPFADHRDNAASTESAVSRVLIVTSTLHIGGAERVMALLAKNLSRERFNVTVCYLKEDGMVGDELRAAGIALVPLPGRRYGHPDRFTFWKLRRLIRERNIQLIHTHDMHGLMDACMCKLLMPRLKHVHTFHFGNYRQREPRYQRIERMLWRIPDMLVAVGHEQAATIHELYRIPKPRLRVIWNGVDAPKTDIAPEVLAIVQREDRPIIASISTLIPQKGLHHLLAAAAILRDRKLAFVLLIAGDGPLQETLREQVKALDLAEQVHFLGWVSEAASRVLPACDIFAQSSLWEAMSVVVLEAMAAGKAVVVTDVGENSHVIEAGTSGLCVPSADPKMLAEALAKLINDSHMRQQMGAAARERYSKFFTVKQMTERHESLYSELLPSRVT